MNSDDCLGNSAFVEHTICQSNYSTTSQEKEECTTLTCNDGSVALQLDDDASAADDDAGVVVDDDAGIVDDNVSIADDDAGVVIDDDAGMADDTASIADDDMGMAEDEASMADNDADIAADTGKASRIGSFSPSVVLTAARGLAFFIAAPCLAASLL